MAEVARRAHVIAALMLAAAVCAPARAATVKLFAFDEKGAPLKLAGLLARLSRADEPRPAAGKTAFWALPLDGTTPPARVTLAQTGPLVTASWDGGPAKLELVWPVKKDGYGDVLADNDGRGFGDGAAVFLDEEIAATQYRLFNESWDRSVSASKPYAPDREGRQLAEDAKRAMAGAAREKVAPRRAAAFKEALRATAAAWEKELYERGLQNALDAHGSGRERFGVTLDDSLLKRLDDLDWIADSVARSGAGWVRLVFRPNGGDFTYASPNSFNEYEGVVAALSARKIKVLGAVLDTAQWPQALTPDAYAERAANLALHFKGRISAWEVGSEINGDWLGGASHPLTPDQVFKIYSAGATKAKEADPDAETVATLYWWEATAPDRAHSLSGWLKRFVPRGFGQGLDVVGLELFPEDNPVGPAFERAFDTLADAVPGPKLMLSSFGYVEGDALKGYWWLAPDDADGGRKDLVYLYTAASCAMRGSVCGGFWWQALDQMLPPGRRRAADLFKAQERVLAKLGQKP